MSTTPLPLLLDAQPVSLATLRGVLRQGARVELGAAALQQIDASRALIARIVDQDAAVYGVNTGFGLLAQTRIPRARLVELQRNLVLSHAAGTGPKLDDAVVRLVLVLKLISLARGYSGVRREVLQALQALVNHDALPCIPSRGSVGASGDLAPLAHLAAALLGEGHISLRAEVMPAAQALAQLGLAPLTLAPKEGLALLNGTQVSTALALKGLFAAQQVFAAALVTGAMSVDALKGSDAPFDARIHAARGQIGQDPYSLRCQPQVMGACLDSLGHVARILEIEANAATDNPLVFAADEAVLSGGNFHAEPVGFAADCLAVAVAEIGAICERRTAVMVDPKMSNLPAFLVPDSGLNSGFMIAQVTAAALVSENKSLAHPASVDSIPTCANQEDHVSMATYAARRLTDMTRNAATVVGIELLCAGQGIEFHRPLRSSAPLERALELLRGRVANYGHDRLIHPDIEAATALVESGELGALVNLPGAA